MQITKKRLCKLHILHKTCLKSFKIYNKKHQYDLAYSLFSMIYLTRYKNYQIAKGEI